MNVVKPSTDDSFVYSCSFEQEWGYEQFIAEHVFAYQLSGETHVFHQKGTIVLRKNEILLAHKNQFAKSLKTPGTDAVYKVISVILKTEDLKAFAIENRILCDKKYKGKYNIVLKPDSFLISYFNSLLPYTEQSERSTKKLASLKVNEAIQLLMQSYPELNDFLFDFSDPHKINLEEFMLRNFHYNAPIENFAKLTGRSLAGFKRDFVKQFNTPPAKWIKNKRLSEAYYLIHQKKSKPADIYLKLGFENLSHFYTAFKRKYGVTPTESLTSKTNNI
jgi:AraC-like DNA-binding protein